MDTTEKVLERLATTEGTTLSLKRDARRQNPSHIIALGRTEGDFENEVLEIRNVAGSLHLARKVRHHDAWDPPIVQYDPYGPGQPVVQDDVDLADGAPGG